MTKPPARDATVPRMDMPPLVPGGTRLSVVIKMGDDLDNMPSSDARVSPKQQEKWLDVVHQPLPKRVSLERTQEQPGAEPYSTLM
jgi:hypothetical protein